MTSLQRSVVVSSAAFVPASAIWAATLAVGVAAGWLIARSCGYEYSAVARYLVYVALHVLLPGIVSLRLFTGGPVSLTKVFTLGLPTGFALEIFTFLGLASLDAKTIHPWIPLVWIAVAAGLRRVDADWPVRVRISADHAGILLALAIIFLGTALMAVSQMFSESPLAYGLPTRAIFHDWVYLVSRAAVIKNNWPLDDPSLSNTPLQYHYFMMVHAAAASWTTGVEITAVLLRLIFVPLGAVLVAQAYALGRALCRTPWGGVLAAGLTVLASEASFAPSYGDPMFLGLFVRWLFVSPTFFFGMIFCGALLLLTAEGMQRKRCDVRFYAWVFLLGAATTGAKGTVVPVVLCALGLWTSWRFWCERRLPVRFVFIGVCLTLAFAVVYVPMMSAWRTGDAGWQPFHVFQLSGFWKEYVPVWTRALAQWLPAGLAGNLAMMAAALVVFCGTCGVRLLAIPYLLWGDAKHRNALLTGWLGAFFVASAGMGVLMELNSYGELYLLLMMRLPMAVLTAAFFVAAFRRIVAWRKELDDAPSSTSASPFAARAIVPQVVAGRGPRLWFVRGLLGGTIAVLIFALGMQSSLWWTRNRVGFTEWLKTPSDLKPDAYMRDLQEALLWIRHNTEANAVLVSNACTPENMKKDHWGALDKTLTGVHFYYSALSERRLWFEGPNYILDTSRARLRASLASNFFYRGRALDHTLVSRGPSYILLDRSLQDGATVSLRYRRLFANSRMEVYDIDPAHVVAAD